MRSSQPQWLTIDELADTNPEALRVGTDPRSTFKYVDLSAVTGGKVAWNAASEVTLLTAPSRARRVLRRGDVLFGTVRPNLQSHGYVDWAGTGALVGSTGFSVIRAKPEISDPRYLFHCIMSSGVTAQANRDAVGSSYPALNDSDVRRFLVFAPPIGEQAVVAQILDTIDTTIRQTEAIIEKLKQVKQGLLHDLLTRGIDANGELRPPQSQAPHLYKDSPLGWIPRVWSQVQLGNLAALQRGHDIVAASFRPGPYPVISSSGVIGHHSVATSRGPNVVVGRKGSIGTVHFVETDFWAHDTSLFVTHFFGNEPHFVFYLFDYLQLGRYGTKSGSPSLNRNDIHPLTVARPEADEQKRIIGIVAAHELLQRESDVELGKLKRLKAGLMDDLLTGRVRVTPLLDAAAHA